MRLVAALALCMIAYAAEPVTKPAKPKRPVLSAEQRAVQAMMRSLSLRDRVAQLVIGVCYGDVPSRKSPEYESYRHWVHDLHIGGLIVNNRVINGVARNADPHAMAVFLNQMQRLARTPLIVGADFERGASMRTTQGAKFPYDMAFGAARDLDAVRDFGLATAREARAVGVQWLFAPDADVNNNPANPVINIRSFGENPGDVAQNVAAFIDGAHSDPENRVLVTAKHFPGHGDTNVDSHLGLARLDATKERMLAVELKPFETAIAHNADAIMTAHMAVPAIEPDEIPATASPKVLTGLLREELGFKGLIVTDALDMLGFTSRFSGGEGSVRAIEAGADVLLMPPDPEAAIRAVLAAVAHGRIPQRRIDESVIRVLAAKIRVGIVRKKPVNLDAISDVLDDPEVEAHAQQISDRAVTLVRNDRDLLPLASNSAACLVITTGLRNSQYGLRMMTEFRKRSSGRAAIVDPSMPLAAMSDDIGDTSACSAVVVAVFSIGGPLNGDLPAFIDKLTSAPQPSVLIAMGSPYLPMNFPKTAAYLETFSPTALSETAAIRAVFGEIAIAGHLPVTIPGFAQYGDGIQLPAHSR